MLIPEDLIKRGEFYEPASEAVILSTVKRLKHKLPEDYLQFIRRHNGGWCYAGEWYIHLWGIEALPDRDGYSVFIDYCPELLFFGSDGAGEAYGFDYRKKEVSIIAAPFIFNWDDSRILAQRFSDFFIKLDSGELF